MFIRLLLLVIAPPVLIYTFAARVLSEFLSSFKYAWWDCQEEMAALRRAWETKSIRPEDWK
ncbi:hypothetical protein [Phyllobacterium leguminum]|uniref:Uncharacterized protein n=1 Tax=Phyllobacterium leguminum TaxID=314237 RepID=A0A318TK20_9HYPH|nr:hypothetical protein [Phyllobacterium leguminum]PYE89640.1 hypothetical protein C7477_103148 [Phyllobacterium leguminum]